MSWSDEELDAIFKEASLQEKVPVYQDAYFDEIANLLPQKRKRKGFIWFFASMISLVAISATYFTIYSLNKSTTPKLAKTHSETKIEKSEQTKQTAENKLNSNKTSSTITNPENINKSAFDNSRIESIETEVFNKESFSNDLLSQDVELIRTNSFDENESDKASKNIEALNSRFNTDNVSTFFHPLVLNELLSSPFPAKVNRHNLNVHVMVGFAENFIKNENENQRPIFGARLGVNYEYQLKDYSFSAGLAYANYQTHDLNLNRTSKVYGFEVNKYSQIIDYKSIYLIQLPLSAGKSFGNHKLSFGLTPSYVLGSTVDFSKAQNGILIEDSRIYGNKLGLNHFALSAQIAYDLKMAKNYSLGVSLSNLLVNPLDETRFEGTINKLPFQANISFKKYFTIK